jgi:hypothetical protein
MTEPQQQPTPWHVVWVRVLTRAYDAGRNVEQAIADADKAVAAYKQRLAEDGEKVTHGP